MKEQRYENEHKIYIKVEAVFHQDGRLLPVALWWENGRRYTIDHVTDIRRAASLKAGGSGIRYTCMVHGRKTCLFYEEDRWFMERPDSDKKTRPL